MTITFEWFDSPNKYWVFSTESLQRVTRKVAKYSDLAQVSSLAKRVHQKLVQNSQLVPATRLDTVGGTLQRVLRMLHIDRLRVSFSSLAQFIPSWVRYLKEVLAVSQLHSCVQFAVNMRSALGVDSARVFQTVTQVPPVCIPFHLGPRSSPVDRCT